MSLLAVSNWTVYGFEGVPTAMVPYQNEVEAADSVAAVVLSKSEASTGPPKEIGAVLPVLVVYALMVFAYLLARRQQCRGDLASKAPYLSVLSLAWVKASTSATPSLTKS